MRTEARLLGTGTEFAGRYRIEALIGQGGAGAVYRALDVAQDRQVALKVLAPEVIEDDVGLSRFRREADLVQRLSHPNVVRLYDFGRTSDGAAYLVLELLRGQPLATLLRASGPMPLERVWRIGSQILKGLMAAHALGIVHRDIKPSNIHVADFPGEPDFVTIVDFGIAKTPQQGDATTGLTRTGAVIGTPGYMAPEQVLGGTTLPSTDLYAAGIVLAELLAGHAVFAQGTAMQILVSQASPTPVPLPATVVRSPLGPLIERATQKDVSRRTGSAAEMLAALNDAASPTNLRAPAAHVLMPATAGLPVAPIVHGHSPVAPGRAPPAAKSGCGPLIWIVAGAGALGCLALVTAVALYMSSLNRTDAPEPVPTAAAVPSSSSASSASADAPAPSARDAGGPSSGLPPFNRRNADLAVQVAANAAARSCNTFGPPFGPGEAFVGFIPSGAAKGTTANHPNNQTRLCMESALRSTRIAPFERGPADPMGTAPFNVQPPATATPAIPTATPTSVPSPRPSPPATTPKTNPRTDVF